MPEATTTEVKAKVNAPNTHEGDAKTSDDYVLPIVHVSVPAKVIDVGFWGGLVGAVALGVLDPPLGVLVGAGVVIARHQSDQ